MVEKIKNLVFRGAAFSSRTSLSLFPSENHRLCLIYGRNGTGKSTISKAFLKIAGKDFPEIMDACLEDYSGSAITYQDMASMPRSRKASSITSLKAVICRCTVCPMR